MWPFAKIETVEEPPAPVDPEAESLALVRTSKAVLDTIDADMLAFRTRFKVRTDKFGRLLAIESATLTGRAKIEAEWQGLLRRRDKAVAEWHSALHEWVGAKEARERERKELTP
jgi:hypothetical protein